MVYGVEWIKGAPRQLNLQIDRYLLPWEFHMCWSYQIYALWAVDNVHAQYQEKGRVWLRRAGLVNIMNKSSIPPLSWHNHHTVSIINFHAHGMGEARLNHTSFTEERMISEFFNTRSFLAFGWQTSAGLSYRRYDLEANYYEGSKL